METQILHFDGNEWRPYTYRWNNEQTDAVLLDSTGGHHTFEIIDADAVSGMRSQTWRFSSRTECQRCHNVWAGPVLAFNTPQLNKEHNYGGLRASQLETFAHIKLIGDPVSMENRPKLVNPNDTFADNHQRARLFACQLCPLPSKIWR